MNRCATCKHFGVSYHPNKDGLADCAHIAIWPMSTAAPGTQAVITATAADDQGLSAVLMVGPDFGCVHHTPKKTKKSS
jgi:hypothetical protein